MKSILRISLFSMISLIIAACSKDDPKVNIQLYDKPLSVIKANITGKWKLNYAYGGIVAQKHVDRHNSYMIINPDHIIIGGDSTGIKVDTAIVWVRSKNIFNDSTYLMSYKWSGYPFPEYNIVDRIKNDTLIVIQNVYDPIYYYYTK
jgi:hypothetical protein